MKITFKPHYQITTTIANNLMRIEQIKEQVRSLPITAQVLAGLRETARLASTHYSTKIEGNRLTQREVINVINHGEHIPARQRDEKEILGYYEALTYMEKLIDEKKEASETALKKIHALVMSGGKKKVKPSEYRDGQNVIRDSYTHSIVYLPPEAHDVPQLMKELLVWLQQTEDDQIPCPLQAGIAHYQYATIHPYYDGNGRTARLLTSWILHHCGYGLKGIYSLEDYYAQDLQAYYKALSKGPSHNYYFGRAEADITPWLEYFIKGMAASFEKVRNRAAAEHKKDTSAPLRSLDPKQRKVVALFQKQHSITSKDVQELFHLTARTARAWCLSWVSEGFLSIENPSNKKRTYTLASNYRHS